MTPADPHIPVLLEAVVEAMVPEPPAGEAPLVVDATFGAGGYSSALLARGARVIALDRDPGAGAYAAPLAARYPQRFHLVERRFSNLEAGVAEARPRLAAPFPLSAPVSGVAFDLGVSSMQVDEGERGFSFMRDGPLDMRMGRDGPTAAEIVNTAPEAELVRLFRLYGEEPRARRIAKALVERRETAAFARTLDLADAVEQAVGGRRGAPTHPATRVFQALRIAVNEELDEIQAGLQAAERLLAPGGRLAVVTFHSLEDRIVKAFLIERSGRLPAGSRHLPPAPVGPAPSFELLFSGARTPEHPEVAANPRARSAKLRAAVRTDAPAHPATGAGA